MKPLGHSALIKLWADGAKIQRKYIRRHSGELAIVWLDDENPDWFADDVYRVAPQRNKFRVAKLAGRLLMVHSDIEASRCQGDEAFIEWITEWVEYD